MAANLRITSPKRIQLPKGGWEGFFPYYAGYPEAFATEILRSADLSANAIIADPWNGSGTTTYAASKLGFSAIGIDLNPVMVIVGRARMLPPSEADSLEPLCLKVIEAAKTVRATLSQDDPLLRWFGPTTATTIRSVEESIRSHFVGQGKAKIDVFSGLASSFYVALFSVCRSLANAFRATNPTWFKHAKNGERRISIQRLVFEKIYFEFISSMAHALRQKQITLALSEVRIGDSADINLSKGSIDLILTSPPYCTRIDYTAATRIELAILAPAIDQTVDTLRASMLGSINVPKSPIAPSSSWGGTCNAFLQAVKAHPSRASSTYYYKTHLDYFEKLSKSICALSASLKSQGKAILVVQDSYYKDLHNDLATVVTEIGQESSLILTRREDFKTQRSMSGLNTKSRRYNRPTGATETVLCFEKQI